MLTDARIRILGTDDTRPLTTDEWRTLTFTLVNHRDVDPATITFACLECGSIGESESREARDTNVQHVDFTCCNVDTTVLFRSIPDPV